MDAARLLGLERATTTPVRPFIFGLREAPSSFKCTRSPGLSSIDVISPSPWRLCLSGRRRRSLSCEPFFLQTLTVVRECLLRDLVLSHCLLGVNWTKCFTRIALGFGGRLCHFFALSPSSTSRRMAIALLHSVDDETIVSRLNSIRCVRDELAPRGDILYVCLQLLSGLLGSVLFHLAGLALRAREEPRRQDVGA